jgi:iron(III) transport system substrate-binding protein
LPKLRKIAVAGPRGAFVHNRVVIDKEGGQTMGSLTRRDFVRLAGGATALAATGGVGGVIQACGGTAAPKAPAGPVPADVSKLYDAAKKEGTLTWWTAHYEQSAAEKMRDAFKKKYPGIEIELLRQTAQVINTRLGNELKTGTTVCDVFCSTDEAHYPPLKKQGVLAVYKPPDIELIPKDFQTLDPDDQYHLGALGFVLINYRSDKVSSPPQSWKDLLDPKWKGQISTGHPAYSGYVGNWVVAMIDKYGEDYIKKLAANNPKVNKSVNDTVTDILAGERNIGAGPDNFSLAKKAAGNPIDVQFPTDFAILIAGPVGILKDSKHPNASRLFVNFMYSKEYSEALASTYNYPLRTDVPSPNGKKLSEIKWYRNNVDRLTKGIPEAIASWRTIMGV